MTDSGSTLRCCSMSPRPGKRLRRRDVSGTSGVVGLPSLIQPCSIGLVGAERADVHPVLAAGREADGALPHQERAVAHRALAVDVLSPDDQDAFASSRSF